MTQEQKTCEHRHCRQEQPGIDDADSEDDTHNKEGTLCEKDAGIKDVE